MYLISCFFYHLIFYSMAAQTRTGSQRYQKFATTTKRPTGCTRYSQRSAVALSISYFSQFLPLFSPGFASSTAYFLRPRISSAIIFSFFSRGESIFLSLSVSQLTTFRHFALTITSDSPVIFPPIRYSSKNTTLRAPFFLLLFFLTFANLLPLYNPTKGNFSAIWCYSSA